MDAPLGRSGPLRGRVVVIHHDHDERIRGALHTAGVVCAGLSQWVDAQITTVHRQPDRRPVPARVLLSRRARQWRLERQWAKYLGTSQRWVLSSGLLGLRGLQLANPHERQRLSGQTHVELSLTAKHALTWREAFEDDVDILVVLEDDARVGGTSQPQIEALFRGALALGRTEDLFIDLAGGLPLQALRDAHLEAPVGPNLTRMALPTANTTCAYLVGRRVVADLAAHVILNPERMRLAADWLIHDVFLALPPERASEVVCLRPKPYPLVHGSFAGVTPSSIR